MRLSWLGVRVRPRLGGGVFQHDAPLSNPPLLPGSLRPTPLPADQPVEAVHGGVAGAPGASTPSPEARLYALGVAGVWAPVAGCTHTSAGCLVAIGCAGRAAMLSTADIAAASTKCAHGKAERAAAAARRPTFLTSRPAHRPRPRWWHSCSPPRCARTAACCPPALPWAALVSVPGVGKPLLDSTHD